ncbi:MAG: Smr/MutS family protein [Mahellales bacterium]
MVPQKYKEINIKQGMPTVKMAEQKLITEICDAKRNGIVALKVIHGYGSTGVGGKLRVSLRKVLNQPKLRGIVKTFIPGEEWSISNQCAKSVVNKYPYLRKDEDLSRHNVEALLL